MTERCGYPTKDGGDCEHPIAPDDGDPDRCWIDSHNETETTSPRGGRPTKLHDHWDDVMEAARMGKPINGCARVAGVDESTLHRWLNRHEEFASKFRKARAEGETRHLETVDDSGSQFVLERSFGWTKKKEIEHQGDADLGGATVVLDSEYVDDE